MLDVDSNFGLADVAVHLFKAILLELRDGAFFFSAVTLVGSLVICQAHVVSSEI